MHVINSNYGKEVDNDIRNPICCTLHEHTTCIPRCPMFGGRPNGRPNSFK